MASKLDLRPPLSDLLAAQAAVVRACSLSAHRDLHQPSLSSSGAGADQQGGTGSSRKVKLYAQLAGAVRIPGDSGGRAVVTDGLSKAELVAYRAHLQLLASAVGETNVQRSGVSAAGSVGADGSDSRSAQATFTRLLPAAFGSSSLSSSSSVEAGVPPAGYFAGICLEPTDYASHSHTGSASQHAADEKRQWLTQGNKCFLEAQYWDVLSHALDEAVLRDEWQVLSTHEAGTSRQQRLKSYVAYLQSSNQLPAACAKVLGSNSYTASSSAGDGGIYRSSNNRLQTAGSNSSSNASAAVPTPLWAFVYHCLRVGDLSAVCKELGTCLSLGHFEGAAAALAVVQALQQLLQLTAASASAKGHARGSAQSLTESEVQTLIDSVQQCRTQYEREYATDEETSDPFRLMVFNLLGFANNEQIASTALPGFSLEDFLWANLWFIQYVRILLPVVGNAFTTSPLIAK
jgi:hypothetical protein